MIHGTRRSDKNHCTVLIRDRTETVTGRPLTLADACDENNGVSRCPEVETQLQSIVFEIAEQPVQETDREQNKERNKYSRLSIQDDCS